MQVWTEKEDVFLSQNYRIKPCREIAEKLDRSVSAVRERARRLGVSRINALRLETEVVNEKIEKRITASGGLVYRVGNVISHRMMG